METSYVSGEDLVVMAALTSRYIGAFICCDGPHQYIPEYEEKLGSEYFQ